MQVLQLSTFIKAATYPKHTLCLLAGSQEAVAAARPIEFQRPCYLRKWTQPGHRHTLLQPNEHITG
jgi:hypothetical protein